MGVLNRRNAVLGWLVWQSGKYAAKRKARDAVPGRVDDSMRPNKSALAAAVAAAGGALWFWRRRRADSAES
jgi:MYXO-CTERM domain-containing protein